MCKKIMFVFGTRQKLKKRASYKVYYEKMSLANNAYGEGKASERIVEFINKI